MATVAEVLTEFTQRFSAADIDTPRLDARILIAHVLDLDPSLLFARSDQALDGSQMNVLAAFVERRLRHEPVSRIIGEREFYGLPFKVTGDTLDPRPDTETIVTAALQWRETFGEGPVRILDFGTGTACILLALLNAWPQATGVGVDFSEGALSVARENAVRLGMADRARFVKADWRDHAITRALDNAVFEIVVSNPPYVTEDELANLAPSVRLFDPSSALAGGRDGLDAYRALLPASRALLAHNGRLMLEIGAGQAEAVKKLAENAGFKVVAEDRDLAGFLRCLTVAVAAGG